MKAIKMRRIYKIFLYTLLGVILLFTVSYLIILKGKNLRSYLLGELNKKLLTEVSLSAIHFSPLSKFPDLSFSFSDVLIKSIEDQSVTNDTLLYAESILLSFKFWDFFRQQYILKKLNIENGFFYPRIYENGQDNFHIWKSDSANRDSKFILDFKLIRIRDSKIHLMNESNKTHFGAFIHDTRLKGGILSDAEKTALSSLLDIHEIQIKDKSYLNNTGLKIEIGVSREENDFHITNGFFEIDGIKNYLSGEINQDYYNLNISSKKVSLRELSFHLENYFPHMNKKMLLKGKMDYDAHLSGKFSPQSLMEYTIKFVVSSASFKSDNSLNFDNISLSGRFDLLNNISNAKLFLENINASLKNSTLHGQMEINNFKSPQIQVAFDYDLFLPDINDFLSEDKISFTDGRAMGEILSNGILSNWDINKKSILQYFKNDVTANIENGKLFVYPITTEIYDINTSIKIDKDLNINNIRFIFSDTEIDGNGMIRNLSQVFQNGMLDMYFSVKSNSFSFSKDLVKLNKNNENQNNIDNNTKYKIQIDYHIGEFDIFDKKGSEIKGELFIEPNVIRTDFDELKTTEGNLSGDLTLQHISDNKNQLLINTDLTDVNVKELFRNWDNFGQQTITYKNLDGILSGKVSFSSDLDSAYKIIDSSIVSSSSLTIKKGKLINFEPLQKASKYVRLSELSEISFSDLHNEILIHHSKVIIPFMDVSSSAADLSFAGEHNFNSRFNYNLQIALSELLTNKAKRSNQNNAEFGYIAREKEKGIILFLTLSGDKDNFRISYNKKAARLQMKENVKLEKEVFKELVQDEFYAKDKNKTQESKTNNRSKDETKNDFLFEWDDEPDTTEIKRD